MRYMRNILIIILLAKMLSLLILWYVQSEGVNYHPNNSKLPEYKRYNVNNIINPTLAPDPKSAPEPTTQEAKELAAYGPNISHMLLKGLFKRKTGGFVIIALKAKPNDSEVIGIGETFQGYTLTMILKNGAIFNKDEKTFSLYFSEDEQQNGANSAQPNIMSSDDGGIKRVAKTDIVHYAKNVNQIWKDIGIIEVKDKGKITGFKVTRIKPNTPFAELGLRRGDIIIKANNKVMTSYKDALAIYKGIDTLDALELTVLRNNQETEIVYEIN